MGDPPEAVRETVAHPSVRHRFALRIPSPLSIFLTIVIVVIAGLGLRFGVPIWRTQAVIREVERLGGRYHMDIFDEPQSEPPVTALDEIRYIELESCPADANTLRIIRGLPNLAGLFLTRVPIIDTDLSLVRGHADLGWLSIYETRIGDAGLAHLREMKSLQILFLARNRITDAGLRHLSGLTNLVRLYLDEPGVGDDGLRHLGMVSAEPLSRMPA